MILMHAIHDPDVLFNPVLFPSMGWEGEVRMSVSHCQQCSYLRQCSNVMGLMMYYCFTTRSDLSDY